MKKNILFLCTGNSCRSQMAEGLGIFLLGTKFNFYSAGTKKHGLNANAVKVMQEIGIDISKHLSQTLNEFSAINLDYIFTVCADADEKCPYIAHGNVIHVAFDDPPLLTQYMTDQVEKIKVYRRVRDQLKEFILDIEKYL